MIVKVLKMERQQVTNNSLTLESSLTDLILKSNSEKIRRPPNAFMLFARDHRTVISKQHPEISNKTVSTILGQIWKNTAEDVREKYFSQAKLLGDLHKRCYPDYVYSPREARIQKMNKRRKKDYYNSADLLIENEDQAAVRELIKSEDLNAKAWTIDQNHESKSSPEYIPNNPEYFIQGSPDMEPEEDSELNLQPRSEYSMESQGHQGEIPIILERQWIQPGESCRLPTSTADPGINNRERLGSNDQNIPSYEKQDGDQVVSFFTDHPSFSYATPTTPFYNPPAHFNGPVNSYFCSPRPCTSPMPRPYGLPYPSYWNPPIFNPPYYPRDCFWEDFKPYSFPPHYHRPDFYRLPFGYFDRFGSEIKQSSTNHYSHLNEGSDLPRRLPSDFPTSDSGSYSDFNGRELNGGFYFTHNGHSRNNEAVTQHGPVLRSNGSNTTFFTPQNPTSRPGSKSQPYLNSHLFGPTAEGRICSEQYQHNISNSNIGKTPEEPSSEDIFFVKQHQNDSSGGIMNKNKSHFLSSGKSSETHMQSEELPNSVLSTGSIQKLNSLYVENENVVNSNLKDLHTIPTQEKVKQQHFNSEITNPQFVNNDSNEITNTVPMKLKDVSVSNSIENSSMENLRNKNELSMNRSEDCIEIISEGKQTIFTRPYYEEPIQSTKVCPGDLHFADFHLNQDVKISQDVVSNVTQPQLHKPFVKMEATGPNMMPKNEMNGNGYVAVADDDGNNEQFQFKNGVIKTEQKAPIPATSNHSKLDFSYKNFENSQNRFFCYKPSLENPEMMLPTSENTISQAFQMNRNCDSKPNSHQTCFQFCKESVSTPGQLPGSYSSIRVPPYKIISPKNKSPYHEISGDSMPKLEPFT